MPPGSATKKKGEKAKSPRCKTCGKAIRVPQGWTAGPAVRRHYWAKHRDVMQPKVGKAK
jgi:hypothetical protein